MTEIIQLGIKMLYMLCVSAIRALITPYADGVQMKHLFRYIDDDCEQSIYRVKKVQLVDGKVVITFDSNTGETFASDVHADYDEDFENESELVLDDVKPYYFDLDFIYSIWYDLENYTIPRLKGDTGNA